MVLEVANAIAATRDFWVKVLPYVGRKEEEIQGETRVELYDMYDLFFKLLPLVKQELPKMVNNVKRKVCFPHPCFVSF